MLSYFWSPTYGDFILVPKALQEQKVSPLVSQKEQRWRDDFAMRGDSGQSVGKRGGTVEPIRASVPQQDRTIGQYIDHGDGTITDTKTGLMWKRCSEGLSGDNCEDGKTEGYSWDNAVKRFKKVEYAGYKGNTAKLTQAITGIGFKLIFAFS